MTASFKGLQGHYAGFVSRAIGLVVDVAIIILVIALINGAIALTLELFLNLDVNQCPPFEFDLDNLLSGGLVCNGANWLRVVLSLVVNPGYFALFWTLGGQTPGQYITGVRVVRLDGRRLNFLRSLVRWVGLIVSFLPLGLGYFWCLWDDRRQIFADKMARTVVVYAWEAKRNEFLLDRIWTRLRRGKRSAAPPAGAQLAPTRPVRLELVQVVLPVDVAARGGGAIRVLQDAVRRGDLSIVTSTVMVKDETGAVGYVGSSDLAAGDQSATSEAMLARDPRLSAINLELLMADVANSSAVWSIIVEDTFLTPVLTTLSAAKVAAKVFDLDLPGHEPLTFASVFQSVAQPDGLLPAKAGPA
jgi:uncharacterized RDD family membrane protein YckC